MKKGVINKRIIYLKEKTQKKYCKTHYNYCEAMKREEEEKG